MQYADVSVVIPCYRCADTIVRAVASVANQTWRPREVLLVEDCSRDEGATLAALSDVQERFKNRLTIKIIPLSQNGGPGEARNAGWVIATQPYLAFLDADDSWHPEKLEIQYQWMLAHADVAMTGHGSLQLGEKDEWPDLTALTLSAYPVETNRLLFKNYFLTRSVMLKREIPQRFVEGKRHAEDLLLWLMIGFNGYSMWRLNLPLAYSYKAEFGEAGLSRNLWLMQKGVLDTYYRLCRAGMISWGLCLFAAGFSMLKYVRRWLVSR